MVQATAPYITKVRYVEAISRGAVKRELHPVVAWSVSPDAMHSRTLHPWKLWRGPARRRGLSCSKRIETSRLVAGSLEAVNVPSNENFPPVPCDGVRKNQSKNTSS